MLGIDFENIGLMLLKFVFKSNKINDEYYELWGVIVDFEGLFVVLDYYNYCF